MKKTVGGGEEGGMMGTKEVLDFHDKVNDVLEMQDELAALHVGHIREMAEQLTKEGHLLGQMNDEGHNVDAYI